MTHTNTQQHTFTALRQAALGSENELVNAVGSHSVTMKACVEQGAKETERQDPTAPHLVNLDHQLQYDDTKIIP